MPTTMDCRTAGGLGFLSSHHSAGARSTSTSKLHDVSSRRSTFVIEIRTKAIGGRIVPLRRAPALVPEQLEKKAKAKKRKVEQEEEDNEGLVGRETGAPSPSVEPSGGRRRKQPKVEEEPEEELARWMALHGDDEEEKKKPLEGPGAERPLDFSFLDLARIHRDNETDAPDIVDRLLTLNLFKREDLGGPPVKTSCRGSKTRPFNTKRYCLDPKRNMGCVEPGKALLCASDEPSNKKSFKDPTGITMFIRWPIAKAKKLAEARGFEWKGETWEYLGPIGQCCQYGGYTTDDWDRCSPQARETSLNVFLTYGTSDIGRGDLKYWNFSPATYDYEKGPENKARRREAIMKDLRERPEQLRIDWGVFRHIGIDDAELEWVTATREARRAKSDEQLAEEKATIRARNAARKAIKAAKKAEAAGLPVAGLPGNNEEDESDLTETEEQDERQDDVSDSE